MSYIRKHLIAGETIVYRTRLHWVVLVGPLLLAAVFGALGVALLAHFATAAGPKNDTAVPFEVAGAILIAVAVVCVISGIFKRNATEMAVTDKRVVIKVGIAARRTIELLLSKVESIGVEESVMGRLLGYGTVILRGTGGTPEPFDTVDHPIEFRKQVEQQIEKWQDSRVRSAPNAP